MRQSSSLLAFQTFYSFEPNLTFLQYSSFEWFSKHESRALPGPSDSLWSSYIIRTNGTTIHILWNEQKSIKAKKQDILHKSKATCGVILKSIEISFW